MPGNKVRKLSPGQLAVLRALAGRGAVDSCDVRELIHGDRKWRWYTAVPSFLSSLRKKGLIRLWRSESGRQFAELADAGRRALADLGE
jgi:hypothetical protein